MKLAFRSKYGSAEVLSLKETEVPRPKSDEILIKVHAATVNRSDCHLLAGTPFPLRLFTGLFKPRTSCTGTDFAGEVSVVGENVRSFKPGDKLMGFGGGFFSIGSHAEYIVLPEDRALKISVHIPPSINYHEAAACMEGAFYAAAQVCPMKPKPGQKALVNGATGAIGSSYVQFLHYYGVSTTAVCLEKHEELLTSLGANRIIDFATDDFTKDPEKYDIVFDAVGKSSFFKCRRILTKNGMYTSSDGFINLLLLFIGRFTKGKRVVFFFPKNFTSVLLFIKSLVETGQFKAVIDREYPLEQIPDAYRYVASGQKVGNVIIKMDG